MEEKMNYLPLIGDIFPMFDVQTTHGKLRLPDYFKGKWFVLFSHPGDFTPVCTTEFVEFARKHKEFRELECELIGLSIDQVFSHMKWTEWIKDYLKVEIEFPIIADKGELAERLGMIHPGKGSNTVRAVFVVDPEGVLRAMIYYPQEIGRNVNEILRMLSAFRVSDKEKVAIPANWPNSSILNDKVIIPPPTDEATARKRKDEYKCFDWWFCYRDLK